MLCHGRGLFRHTQTDRRQHTPRFRARMIRVWTAQHVGKLDLLRACLAEPELRGWVEERSSDPDKGKSCHICFTDRWTSIPGAIPIDYKQIAGWSIIVSRIEGMTQAADKAELERGLERCREAGCPGYDTDSDVSFFPRTWLLPEHLKDFRQQKPGCRGTADHMFHHQAFRWLRGREHSAHPRRAKDSEVRHLDSQAGGCSGLPAASAAEWQKV